MVTQAATKIDPTILLIGAGALLLLTKWGIEGPLREAKDKVNIAPESKEFFGGLFQGAESTHSFYEDQSGSPNPPIQDWWEEASGYGSLGDWADRGAGPIRVTSGTAVPTSPIIGVTPPSQAARYGGAVRDFFTEGKLLKAIDPFPDWN